MQEEAQISTVATNTPGTTLDDFNKFVSKAGLGLNKSALADNPAHVEDLAIAFYERNQDPATSPNLQVEEGDDYSFLMDCLDDSRVIQDPMLSLALLRCLKVISRKVANRQTIEKEDVKTVVKYLRNPRMPGIASEAASVVLNICYEKPNVIMTIDSGAVVDLMGMVQDSDEDVQANAAGALQSISYQPNGRVHLREMDVLPALLPLLHHHSSRVRTRVVGVIHNMSSDIQSIAAIREGRAIKDLVAMLNDPQVAICGAAAGAIQNLSREQQSKAEIMEADAVPPLTELMFGADVPAQVCAAGALLNLLGPHLEADPVTGVQQPEHLARRQALTRIVMLSLVTGMAFHGLYTDDD